MDTFNNGSIERPSTPDSRCAICLDTITNKSHTNECFHLFCFDCLQSWSNEYLEQSSSSDPTCPVCRRTFKYIHHSFDDVGTFEIYTVPILDRLPLPSSRISGLQLLNELFTRIILRNNVRVNHENMDILPRMFVTDQENLAQLNHGSFQNYPHHSIQRPLDGQTIRTGVYVANVWALPLSDAAGHFRHNTSDFYRGNPTELYRLRSFIIRDLVAIRESVRSEDLAMPFPDIRDINGANVIIREIRRYGIQHLRVLDSVRPFLSIHAEHFFHELYNFAYSPYEISDYDRYVQHIDYLSPANALTDQVYQMHREQWSSIPNTSGTVEQYSSDGEFQSPNIIEAPIHQEPSLPIHNVGETIVLNSDDEELQRPNIIEVTSSTDGSNVETLSQSNRSTDPYEQDTVDQPSTSTGIRDSLVRPNNSSQSVHDGLSRVSYSSQVKRGSSDLDTSSSDEESIIATQGSQNARLKSRYVNKKKKKKHQ